MTYPLTTTLNRIWACSPCDEGKQRALKAAGKAAPDDEPITFQQIIEAVGLQDALWCCCAEQQHSKEWRLFAVWCARQVQHLLSDQRSIDALNVAERFAHGQATTEELAAARDAARDAAWTAAKDAASNAAWTAARAAAWAAAWDASRVAAWTASRDAAWTASRDAAWTAAWDAAWEVQQTAFIQLVTTGTLPELQRQEVEA